MPPSEQAVPHSKDAAYRILAEPQLAVTAFVRGQTFLIPRDFLIHSSAYFKAVLDGPFAEGDSGVLEFYDIEPRDFGTWLNLLYKFHPGPAFAVTDDFMVNNLWLPEYVAVWSLCHRFATAALASKVCEALRHALRVAERGLAAGADGADQWLACYQAGVLACGPGPGAALRPLILKSFCRHCPEGVLRRHRLRLDRNFMRAVLDVFRSGALPPDNDDEGEREEEETEEEEEEEEKEGRGEDEEMEKEDEEMEDVDSSSEAA